MRDLKIYGMTLSCLPKTVAMAELLREKLGCDSVITVTPFDVSDTLSAGGDFVLAMPGEVVKLLRKAKSSYDK